MNELQEPSELQQIKILLENLCTLTANLEKDFEESLSLKRRFLTSLLGGLGTALGATVVFSIVISLSLAILNSLFTINWIKPIVKEILDVVQQGKPNPAHK